MQIANQIAGFSLGKADLMRRAMGKKDPKKMAEVKKDFASGAVELGVPQVKAKRLFDLVEHFAGYGFNKSHTVAYAMLAYRTAWLKSHYPREFLAATLSSELDRTDRIVTLITECRRCSIPVTPPDVNRSEWRFTIDDEAIRFGLGAIKNVGRNTVRALVESRREKGEFKDLLDLCQRVGPQNLNRRTLESLVQAGALDSLGGERSALATAIPMFLERAQQAARDAESGQESLFGETNGGGSSLPLPAVDPWSAADTAVREKEVLGFYLSEHPLAAFSREMRYLTSADLSTCLKKSDGTEVRAAGIVTAIKTTIDKKGQTMAFVTIEDDSGAVECLVFSDLFSAKGARIQEERLLWIKARVSKREGDAGKLVLSDLLSWDEARSKAFGLHLEIDSEGWKEEISKRLDELLSAHTGTTPVYLHVLEDGGRRTVMRSRKYRVRASDAVTSALAAVLGPGRARWAPRL